MFWFDLFIYPYQNNATPLYVASQEGHREVVQTLLGAGADMYIARSSVSDLMFNNFMTRGRKKLL